MMALVCRCQMASCGVPPFRTGFVQCLVEIYLMLVSTFKALGMRVM